MKVKFFLVAFLVLFSALNANALMITEVGLKDDVAWAEIYNNSETHSVNIAPFKLTDLDGTDSVLSEFPAVVVLAPGEYAVIWWEDVPGESNASLNLACPDSRPTQTDDGLAILDGETYLDAVCWSNSDETISSGEFTDIQNLFAQSQWPTATDPTSFNQVCADISELEDGMSLSRYLDVSGLEYVDTNKKSNWYLSDSPTPGGTSDQALPVALSSFVAVVKNSAVVLKWRTESETQNLGFNIYRNGAKIGFRKSANTMPHNYEFVDDGVKPGKTYKYFLEDIDFAGNRNRSKIVKIKIQKIKLTTFGALKRGLQK